jgi:squalene synthase HpnC
MARVETVVNESMALASSHYENFPVASVILPKHLREPIALIYQFARQADDFADEGDLPIAERLSLLNAFSDDLNLIVAYIKPENPFFNDLGSMIKAHELPFEPFHDLLSAFKQDVTKTRYQQFDEVLDYCRRSANPIGRLLLKLYKASDEQNVAYSDNVCTALQLINFLQDIAIDFEKNEQKQRIYLCQEEMVAFGISEQMIAAYVNKERPIEPIWTQFMGFNLHRAKALLYAGDPLGRILKGRIGFEMRMIIAGGERIIQKIHDVDGDVFTQRPVLTKVDWVVVFLRALFRV